LTLNHDFEIEINAPVKVVTALYSNHDLLSKWQGGLVRVETLPIKNGVPSYILTYHTGRRKFKITETIVRNELPMHYDVHYKLKGVTQIMNNSFSPIGKDVTKWNTAVEFRFRGLMSLIARFMKAGFDTTDFIGDAEF
jgi:hypothetical protein